MSLPLEIAIRYLKSRPSRLVSSVSLLSIAGIGLGVAALVVAMGLLAGYRREIRERLIGANAEVVVFSLAGGFPDPVAVEQRLHKLPRVRATAAVIYQAGVAASAATPDGADAILKGIDPAAERRVSELDSYLPGAERVLTHGGAGELPGVAIGSELARRLDVHVGDPITLSVPDRGREGPRFLPRSGRFRVARVFRTNFSEYDSEWVFLDREALRTLCHLSAAADVVEVRLDSIDRTEEAAAAIELAAGRGFSVTDWRTMNGSLFSALAIQQTTLFLVIGLIVAVSTFNVVATLVMTVQEKKRDIGVLTAMGAEPRFFTRIFLWLGGVLGGCGVLAGILLGVLVCWTATTFRLLSFPPGIAEIYFVSFIPFRTVLLPDLRHPGSGLVEILTTVLGSLAGIATFSLLVILIAAWIPARRAARLDIAEALRYE